MPMELLAATLAAVPRPTNKQANSACNCPKRCAVRYTLDTVPTLGIPE